VEATEEYKQGHIVKAQSHNKFAQRWIGTYLVKKVIKNQNMELQISDQIKKSLA
jgi:hypothetical protein